MSAEMTIKLVDASPEEQQAIETPPPNKEPIAKQNDSPSGDPSQWNNAKGKESDGAGVQSKSDDKKSIESNQELKTSIDKLTDKLDPKMFSDPIDKLVTALEAPPVQTHANRSPDWTTPGAPPVQRHTEAPPIQTSSNRSPDWTSPGAPPVQKPPIPRVEPITGESKADNAPTSINQILDKLQDKLAKTLAGRQANKFISRGRARLNQFGKQAKNAWTRFGKTELGRTVIPRMAKVAKLVKNSPLGKVAGKAIGKAGQTAVGAIGRMVGAGGTTAAAGTAAGSAASSGTAAAGTATAAAIASNPATLTIAVVVSALAAIPVAAALAAKGLQSFGDYLISQTGNLTEKSGALSAAKARQETSTELNMIKRAESVGPGVAKLVDAQTRYQDAMQDLWTKVLEALIKFAPQIEAGTDAVTAMVRLGEVGVTELTAVVQAMTGNIPGAIATQAGVPAQLRTAKNAISEIFIDRSDDPDPPDQFLMDLLRGKPL